MDIQKLTYANVDKLDELLPMLYMVRDELNIVRDISQTTLSRAFSQEEALNDVIHELEMLRHDLRDDYGNGYAIMKAGK